jgi:hypothetical protein
MKSENYVRKLSIPVLIEKAYVQILYLMKWMPFLVLECCVFLHLKLSGKREERKNNKVIWTFYFTIKNSEEVAKIL